MTDTNPSTFEGQNGPITAEEARALTSKYAIDELHEADAFERGWGKLCAIAAGEKDLELLELRNDLTDVCQLLDGWHQDGTVWSKWDEEVRQRASNQLRRAYGYLDV
jgi:hypothetical protein